MNKRHRIWASASVLSLLLVLFPSWSPAAATPTGLTGIAGNQSVALSWTLPDTTSFPFSFNGTTYNEVYVGSNSFLTFGGGSTSLSNFGASNPNFPSVHICAGDWSFQTVQFRIDNSVTPNQLRIRYQGTSSTSGGSTPNMIYEAVFFRDMPYFDLLVGTYNACGFTSSKLLTNGASLAAPVSFAANTNWRITGLSASLNGNTSTWLGNSNASVAANSNGWMALNTVSRDDSFVSSRLRPSSYLVQASSNGGASWANSVDTNSTTTSYTYRSLSNGTPYVFRVAPYYSNTAITGEWSSQSPSYTPASFPPGQPTSLVATSGNGRATLSWVAPSSVGDSAISGYRIEYSSNGGGSWSTYDSNTWSTSRTRTVAWLTNGTSYVFRVAAINSSATGSYSASATAVPKDPNLPAAPSTLTASPGDGQTVLQWSPVASPYLNGYRIEYSSNLGSSWWTVTSNTYSTSTTRTITGLANGTSYMFRVAAVANYYGRGDFVSASVVPTRSVTTSQNKSTTINSKTKTPKTKYVSKNFASGNTRLSLSSVMQSAKIGMSGMRSLSGSIQSYFGEPCRVSGKTVLRGDRESSCVVRVTMKKSDGSTVVATVTIRGSARIKN